VFRQLRIPAFNIFSRQVSSCQARCEFFLSLHSQFFHLVRVSTSAAASCSWV